MFGSTFGGEYEVPIVVSPVIAFTSQQTDEPADERLRPVEGEPGATRRLRLSGPEFLLGVLLILGRFAHRLCGALFRAARRRLALASLAFLRVLPLSLSALLLAAHFYHAGSNILVTIALATPLLLLARRWWAVASVQIALFVAAAEWIRTALAIAAVRELMGAPAGRMLLILGCVAVFTALSAIPLHNLHPEA